MHFIAQLLEIQQSEYTFRQTVQLRHKAIFSVKLAELVKAVHIFNHNTAVCAVGKVDHGCDGDRPILFCQLLIEQSFECDPACTVQLTKTSCQSVKLIQVTFVCQVDMEIVELGILDELPSGLIAGTHFKFV